MHQALIDARWTDSPKALSLDLGIIEDVRSSRELGLGSSREWTRAQLVSRAGRAHLGIISWAQYRPIAVARTIYIHIYIYSSIFSHYFKSNISFFFN